MNSLRGRLFVILLVATGLIWLCAVAWISVVSRKQIEHVLDTRLQEAARMVSSLVGSSNMPAAAAIAAGISTQPAAYERQLSCQIWSLDGRLVARSSGAPERALTDHASGYSERVVDGEPWRVYSIEDTAKGVRVMVGDRLGLRDSLIGDLVKGLLWPIVLIAPLLGALIWISLGRGLAVLGTLTTELKVRNADDMSPVDAVRAPTEIRPLVDALNGLFAKVQSAWRRERDVTAFAAHELRTPLAGLKTQAQIALSATDGEVRSRALQQILYSVERTSRLVRQLLALARLDVAATVTSSEPVNLGEIIGEIVASAAATDRSRIIVAPALHHMTVTANREILTVALRNIHENAIQHTPARGTVTWAAAPHGTGVIVDDEGPGIPEDELPLVRQRFFRGRHKSPMGSGLGLAIVETAAARLGWTFELENRRTASGTRALFSPARET